MKHRMLAAMAACALATAGSLSAAPLAGAASVGTGSSWYPTATRALSLTDAQDLRAVPAATLLHITVVLPLRDESGLNQYIAATSTPGSALYGQRLTPAQFTATYGPTDAEVQAVTQYLSSQGFAHVTVSANRLLISASGTAAQVQQAFHTALEQFVQNGKTVYANTAAAQVPGALAGDVAAVLGLNNVIAMQAPVAHPSKPASATSLPNYPASYNPQGLQQAYDVGSTASGADTSIAIFAEGDLTQVEQDLRTEEAANNLPQVPVTVVQTGGSSTDTSGVDEWDMDTQYSTGMAETVQQLYLYDAPSLSDSDLTTEFNQFVTDDLAAAGSASFGECEAFAELDGSMAADDEIFAEAAAQGQTVFASAGDTGGFCPVGTAVNGVPAGAPDVNYPASSPDVVAVGGTTLLTNSDGSYQSESYISSLLSSD
ncbi:S53 family peptidase [Alicyclobacillus cycloheptanicus]|uniref:S53 family peptidase n=1 Tax=Alicyclobacillus cycloheptanicus TaxID=1457 RepID=UPI0039676E5B